MISTDRLLMCLIVLTILSVGLQVRILRKHEPPLLETAQADTSTMNPPADVTLDLTEVPLVGNSEATVVLVEFTDFECPYCAQHANTTFKEITRIYVETGKIRYGSINFPLPNHQNARLLASAAICAAKQGRFWMMHERLFSVLPRTRENILDVGRQVGVESKNLIDCLSNSATTSALARDALVASELKLSSTPSFALGVADSNGPMKITRFIVGAQPLGNFATLIDRMLVGN